MKTILVKFVKPHGITWTPVSEKEYRFLVNENRTLFVGDILDPEAYNGYVEITQILDYAVTYYDNKLVKELKHFQLVERKTNVTNITNNPMKTNMFASVIEKYKSQFIPVEEKDVRITIDGNIAIKVNNEYRSINKENEITSYTDEMCFDFPVWSINKPYNKVTIGDIIYAGDQYAKVISINTNGALRCLTYNGDITTQREIKDFFIKQPFVKTLMNMFSNISSDFNPMMMLAFAGDNVNLQDVLMMQMMQNQQDINPMMLLLLNKDKNDNKTFEMMLMMQMMNGKNPFDAFIPK